MTHGDADPPEPPDAPSPFSNAALGRPWWARDPDDSESLLRDPADWSTPDDAPAGLPAPVEETYRPDPEPSAETQVIRPPADVLRSDHPAPPVLPPPPPPSPPPPSPPPPTEGRGVPGGLLVVVVAAVLVLVAAVILFRLLRGGEPSSATGAPSSSPPTSSSSSSAASVSATPAAPPATGDPEAEAMAKLGAARQESRDRVELGGQWVAQLSSKAPGQDDPFESAADGSHTFTAADILAQYEELRATVPAEDVFLLRTGDYSSPYRGPWLWVVLADDGFASAPEVDAWCARAFPAYTPDHLENSCAPRRLSP